MMPSNLLKKRRYRTFLLAVLMTFFISPAAPAGADENWPREIKTIDYSITIYQPQPETFVGNKLTARTAVRIILKGKTEPVFGAIWTTSRVETDRDAGIVTILDIQVDNLRFPETTESQSEKLKALLEKEVPKWEMDISLEGLTTTLAVSEKQKSAAQDMNNDPPKIIFSSEPAVLLLYDKEPQLRKIDNSDMMRVINTPLPVILEAVSNTYYLSGGDIWYKSLDAKGPWEPIEKPPQAVSSQIKQEDDTRASAGGPDVSETIPKIIVATEPTELIVADGEPKFTPISGTNLLYMSNSESDILLEIPTQLHFLLISGRWYRSKSLDGPWVYVAHDKLPQSFLKIPYESANGHLLAFVAGTDQAIEMVLDNQVPQTSTINREDVSVTVVYDGDPKFEMIKGTGMAYAVNTSYSVLRINEKFYLCHEAVWYVSDEATGPWEVATSVPDEIQEIPPDNPHYHVKYVYIYESTPTVVYVGYTPAYMGSYIYGPCVVYGTGYYYYPWWGPVYYYPRPYTWGFHVRYNPAFGWCYGFSYSAGPFRLTVGYSGGYQGWYGPGRFRPYPYRSYQKTKIDVNRNINFNLGDITIGDRNINKVRNEYNIYNLKENRKRNLKRPVDADKSSVQPQAVKNRPNNVYTDKDGSVHRRTDKGWEVYENGKWSAKKPVIQEQKEKVPKTKDSRSTSQDLKKQKPAVNRSPSQLERDHRARQRSSSRASRAKGGRNLKLR